MTTWCPRVRVSDERGAVAVLVSLFIGTAVILVVWFVINIGTWFDHQRHLQVQADAAAMGGAQSYQVPCSDTKIDDFAREYSGLAATDGSYTQIFNAQIGSGSTVTENINADTYPDGAQSSPTDTTTYTGKPCSDGVVDVKMQEAGLGWFDWATGIGPTIHAHARASLLAPPPQSNIVPLGVPEENPTYGEVYYYDEASGTQIASAALVKDGVDNYGRQVWDDVASTTSLGLSVDLAKAALSTSCGGTTTTAPNERCIGVRVALSSSTASTSNLTGNMTTDCAATRVDCFEPTSGATTTGAANPDIFHIRAWTNTAATTTSPVVRNVVLDTTNAGTTACGDAATGVADPYFSNPDASASATCTVDIQADVDFADSTGKVPKGATVCAVIAGSKCNSASLSYQGTGPTAFGTGTSCPSISSAAATATDECWTATGTGGAVTVSANAGSQEVDLQAGDSAMGKTPLTVNNVARTFTTLSTDSGPILAATSLMSSTNSPDAMSFECDTTATACPVSLYATFHLLPSFQVAQSVNDPPVLLRTAGNGAQTQALNCITPEPLPYSNDFKTQMELGCLSDSYTPNTTDPCTSEVPNASPYQCVWAGTGTTTSIIDALNVRFSLQGYPNGGTCSPNNWSTFSQLSAAQQYESTDPRKIFVVLTPLGSFGSGGVGGNSKYYPVLEIGLFYVTYWQGTTQSNGHPSICGNTPDPGYTTSDPYYDGALQPGDVLGHFVERLVIDPYTTPPPTTSCSLAALNGCAIYLTQ